jgi:pimeloyl-ACP methyl ester carboxylesterase
MRYDRIGEGPLLVLLPGLGCDGRMWGSVIDALEVPFTVVVPRIWEAHSMPETALGIRAVLDEVGATRAFFAGLSMGGYAAFECMKRIPEMVRAAVLCDTTAFPDTEERRLARDHTIQLVEAGGFEEVLSAFAASVVWDQGENAPVAREAILRMARDMGPELFIRSSASIRDRGSYLPTLHNSQIPLLFLSGDHDALSPPKLAAEMARAAKVAQAAVIPDAGHMTALENPKAVAVAFDEFFRRFLGVA